MLCKEVAASGSAGERSEDLLPDRIGEVLSPSTRGYDQRTKRPFYARIGVRHIGCVDLEAKTLTVDRLEGGRWLEIGVHGGEDIVRAEPFEAIEIQLGEWWEGADEPED